VRILEKCTRKTKRGEGGIKGIGHKYFSAEKSCDPDSPAFAGSVFRFPPRWPKKDFTVFFGGQEYFSCRHKKNFTTLARGFAYSQNIAPLGTKLK
jgi:hypothetical protein